MWVSRWRRQYLTNTLSCCLWHVLLWHVPMHIQAPLAVAIGSCTPPLHPEHVVHLCLTCLLPWCPSQVAAALPPHLRWSDVSSLQLWLGGRLAATADLTTTPEVRTHGMHSTSEPASACFSVPHPRSDSHSSAVAYPGPAPILAPHSLKPATQYHSYGKHDSFQPFAEALRAVHACTGVGGTAAGAAAGGGGGPPTDGFSGMEPTHARLHRVHLNRPGDAAGCCHLALLQGALFAIARMSIMLSVNTFCLQRFA